VIGRFLEIGGLKNGEYHVATGVTTYYGGMPCYMTTGGTLEVPTIDTGATPYVGVFRNAKTVDAAFGSDIVTSGSGTGVSQATQYKATFLAGVLLARLQSGTVTDAKGQEYADSYPYDTTLSWVAGDLLYVGTGGTWVNSAPYAFNGTGDTGGSIVRGVVMAVGTTYLDVLLY